METSKRAFEALSHAIIVSIFGEAPKRCPFVSRSDISELDGEIVRKGLDNIMLSPYPDLGLQSLQHSGLIAYLMPSVERIVGFGGGKEGHKDLWDHTKRVVRQAPPRLEVRWAALFHDVGKPLAFRKDKKGVISFHGHEILSVNEFKKICRKSFLFPERQFRDNIALLIECLGLVESYEPEWTDSAVRRLRNRVDDDMWFDLLDLARSDVTSRHAEKRLRAKNRTDELEIRAAKILKKDESKKPILPKGLGNALIDAGVKPGPDVGYWRKVLDDRVRSGVLPSGKDVAFYVVQIHDEFKKM